jgi:hypothetical protein
MGAEISLATRISGQFDMAERFGQALKTIEEADGASWALYRAGRPHEEIPELAAVLQAAHGESFIAPTPGRAIPSGHPASRGFGM